MRDIMNIWKIPTFQEKTIDSSPKVGDVLELSRKETFVLECSAFLFLKISLPKMYLICVFFYKKRGILSLCTSSSSFSSGLLQMPVLSEDQCKMRVYPRRKGDFSPTCHFYQSSEQNKISSSILFVKEYSNPFFLKVTHYFLKGSIFKISWPF